MAGRKKLSEREEMVMSVLWSSDEPLNYKEITEKLKARFGKEWKVQTICTFLTRMEKKGYIRSHKVDRYTYFRPEVTLREYRYRKLKEAKEMLLFGSSEEMARFITEERA